MPFSGSWLRIIECLNPVAGATLPEAAGRAKVIDEW